MKLFPFQEKAVEECLSFLRGPRHAVYNSCEMGLGKSIQALTCAARLQVKSVLILCPASVVFVWHNEIKKCEGNSGCAFTVMSYGKILNADTLAQIVEKRWHLLILDEAHYLKSKVAKRTLRVLNSIWPLARYKICLSGTPMTQSVADCWTIFSKIMPEFGDYWDFCRRYTVLQRNPWGTKPTGIRNAEELKKIIRDNFFVRYRKEEVLEELPVKTWQKIPLSSDLAVKLSPEEERQTKEYLHELKACFIEGRPIKRAPPKSSATWRLEQGLQKVPSAIQFAEDILEQDIPIVVFTYHKEVLNRLTEGLREFKPVIIEGSTSQAGREQAVEAFQTGKTNLFIGQIVAAGTGITLTRASRAIFAELDWSPAVVSQAVDRLHRIGQKDAVTAYYLSVEGSIDEDLMDALVSKLQAFIQVIN